ncbi:MAG: cytochrome c biogenesis protein CcdA [Bacteroidales bacterium]|nr:cytochrome c biogenesis protein CcdA [Bacteroidales bacterium]
MNRILRTFLAVIALLRGALSICAQEPESTVAWNISIKDGGKGSYEVIFSGSIADGLHTYSVTDSTSPTEITFGDSGNITLEGGLHEPAAPKDEDGSKVFYKRIVIVQKVKAGQEADTLKGEICWISCTENACNSPEYYEFAVEIPGAGAAFLAEGGETISQTALTEEEEKAGGSIWGLILEAILWGFAMLLTPCVFPMVPMTISFFMKGSTSPAAGRFKAFMYGLFIVLLYTVPISAIIGITWIVGGDAVTADIFNWLATHWLPNIIFFIVFMVFAASFFGAFEITLPSSLVNKSDQNSDRGGLAGIFFMALTLVLVSFSCTGPIVGSVLIKSTQGEFWTPMVTMLAFSIAFALPFTIFAMFPSLLKKLKSGSWLNSVKVVLGFIEVALGFKFLSVADQTYHWGLLDREIYLAIWIVTFTLLGLYLLGKIRFEADSKVEHIGVFRLILVIVDFTFVVYLIPGMFGAPLKALSGYLPPIETQDFVVWNGDRPTSSLSVDAERTTNEFGLELPLGLSGYFSVEEGLEAARKSGKPVFVDITGHGCVNCREMEQRVWSDPEVLNLLKNEFEIVALYTDDKTKLPEDQWVTTESGKVLKDLGRVNSYYVRNTFGVNAQPNYTILSADGTQLVPVRGYNLDVKGFVAFLQKGIDANRN